MRVEQTLQQDHDHFITTRKPTTAKMSDRPGSTTSTRFMRNAGTVNDPEHKLWAPARWVVQMIQYLVALIILTLAEGFKAVVSGKKPQQRRRKEL